MIKKLIKSGIYPIFKFQHYFLIVGTQKAGTTALYRYLSQHPQILQNNTWKEIHYFDKSENYAQWFGWYLGHFSSKFKKKRKLTCDATPSYLYFQHVPKLIKEIEQFRDNLESVLNRVCDFLKIENFHQDKIYDFYNQKHNVGKYK